MGIIKQSVEKDIQSQQNKITEQKSKYEQPGSEKYNTDIQDNEVKEAVKQIIAEKVSENDTPEVKKFLFGSIELTSLNTTDTEEKILAMTEKVNQFDSAYPTLVAARSCHLCLPMLHQAHQREPGGRRRRDNQCDGQLSLIANLHRV